MALHGQPRRRLSKSQSKAAQEAQARRVHEMAILEETTRREAQQPLRREQRAARDAQAESKRVSAAVFGQGWGIHGRVVEVNCLMSSC